MKWNLSLYEKMHNGSIRNKYIIHKEEINVHMSRIIKNAIRNINVNEHCWNPSSAFVLYLGSKLFTARHYYYASNADSCGLSLKHSSGKQLVLIYFACNVRFHVEDCFKKIRKTEFGQFHNNRIWTYRCLKMTRRIMQIHRQIRTMFLLIVNNDALIMMSIVMMNLLLALSIIQYLSYAKRNCGAYDGRQKELQETLNLMADQFEYLNA